MTVNIHFQSGIHSHYTDAAGYFAVIGNFLRTEDDLLAVFFNIGMEAFQSIRGRGQGCPGNHIDLAFINQVEHAVLDNFRIYGQILEIGMNKAVDYRVCHIAYAGLERKQIFRKSSLFYFILQELNQVISHPFSVVIKRSQGAGNIGQITGNNSNNLCRIYRNVGLADTCLLYTSDAADD